MTGEVTRAMSDDNPRWYELGLPDACPECQEESELHAIVERDGDDIPEQVADVGCLTCGHEWTVEVTW